MRRKAMAQHVWSYPLADTGVLGGQADRSLDRILVHVVAPFDPAAWVARDDWGGKDPKPRPAGCRVPRFPLESVRQLNARGARRAVSFVDRAGFADLHAQRFAGGIRQHRDAPMPALGLLEREQA